MIRRKSKEDYPEALRDYYYDLPCELIASYPLPKRENSRLMVFQARSGKVLDTNVERIVDFLSPGDVLVLNNSRVSPRRVKLRRKSGGAIEALFLEEKAHKQWQCLLRPKARLLEKERLIYPHLQNRSSKQASANVEFIFSASKEYAYLLPVREGTSEAAWHSKEDAENWFASYGSIPIPPYLRRSSESLDTERYQCVYAKELGSVAAPTAGLHFSSGLLERIRARGVLLAELELRISYGTFAPLREKNFQENALHEEHYCITPQTADILNDCKGLRIAVGTSSLRALESNFRAANGRFEPGAFCTKLFLKAPDKPRSVQGLMTNFHLPASSLLCLVASCIGKKNTLKLYENAVAKGYRFFSYGDAMLILQ